MVKPITQKVLEKHMNGSIITYGQTTSGKTYTMLGANTKSDTNTV